MGFANQVGQKSAHLELQALVLHTRDHSRVAVADGGHNGSVRVLPCVSK
jgi:hypothetical protein